MNPIAFASQNPSWSRSPNNYQTSDTEDPRLSSLAQTTTTRCHSVKPSRADRAMPFGAAASAPPVIRVTRHDQTQLIPASSAHSQENLWRPESQSGPGPEPDLPLPPSLPPLPSLQPRPRPHQNRARAAGKREPRDCLNRGRYAVGFPPALPDSSLRRVEEESLRAYSVRRQQRDEYGPSWGSAEVGGSVRK